MTEDRERMAVLDEVVTLLNGLIDAEIEWRNTYRAVKETQGAMMADYAAQKLLEARNAIRALKEKP